MFQFYFLVNMYMTETWLSHVVKEMHANPGKKIEIILKNATTSWNKKGGKKNKVSKKTSRRCRNKKKKNKSNKNKKKKNKSNKNKKKKNKSNKN